VLFGREIVWASAMMKELWGSRTMLTKIKIHHLKHKTRAYSQQKGCKILCWCLPRSLIGNHLLMQDCVLSMLTLLPLTNFQPLLPLSPLAKWLSYTYPPHLDAWDQLYPSWQYFFLLQSANMRECHVSSITLVLGTTYLKSICQHLVTYSAQFSASHPSHASEKVD
jgi:hypothetical protein